MQRLSKAFHGLMIGASYAFLVIVGVVLFIFFRPLGYTAYIFVGLYFLSIGFLLNDRSSK